MDHDTDAQLLTLAERLDALDVGACPGDTSPVEFEFVGADAGDAVLLPAELMARIRTRARREGKTPAALVEEWLRRALSAS